MSVPSPRRAPSVELAGAEPAGRAPLVAAAPSRLRRRPYVHRITERYVIEMLLDGEWHERSHMLAAPLDLPSAMEQAQALDGKPFPTRVVLIRTTQVECRTIWEPEREVRRRKTRAMPPAPRGGC